MSEVLTIPEDVDLETLKKGFEEAVSSGAEGRASRGGVLAGARYEKPFTPLKEGEIQLYVDPVLARRFMPDKVAEWAHKLGEYVFSSGKQVYVLIGTAGAYQSQSLIGLVYIILREKLRPLFARFRKPTPPRPSWMTDAQYKKFCKTGRY